MRKFGLFSIVISLILFSAIFAESIDSSSSLLTVYQKVDSNSNSIITSKVDFSALASYFYVLSPDFSFELEQKFKESLSEILPGFCEKIYKKDKNTACTAEEYSLSLSKNFTSKEGYYTFEKTGEFPYKTYRIVVSRIPLDKFGKLYQYGLGTGSEESEAAFSMFSSSKMIDLKKKDENAITAQGMEMFQFSFNYEIEMPGEITSANAGSYSGLVSGSKADFNMIEVMKNSSPLVVESRELNIFVIVIGLGVLLLALVSFMFFKFNKK